MGRTRMVGIKIVTRIAVTSRTRIPTTGMLGTRMPRTGMVGTRMVGTRITRTGI